MNELDVDQLIQNVQKMKIRKGTTKYVEMERNLHETFLACSLIVQRWDIGGMIAWSIMEAQIELSSHKVKKMMVPYIVSKADGSDERKNMSIVESVDVW